MEKKLSIIVPIYKVEKYLSKCIDSLLNQDLPRDEYEIILIDDGSPDKCGEISDEYASKYDNIRVIHQENGGLGAARNTGITAAKGTYIQFVDSDDYLEANVLDGLLERMIEENLDVLRFSYNYIDELSGCSITGDKLDDYACFSSSVVSGCIFLSECLGYACYAWQFIIRRDLLVSSSYFFKPGIFFEDTEWTPRILFSAKRVCSVNTVAYNYLQRSDSITNSVSEKKRKKVLDDKIALIGYMQVQKTKYNNVLWYEGMISSIAISVMDVLSIQFYALRHVYLPILKKLNIYPLSYHHIGTKALKKVRIINFSPYIYCCLIHFLHKR